MTSLDDQLEGWIVSGDTIPVPTRVAFTTVSPLELEFQFKSDGATVVWPLPLDFFERAIERPNVAIGEDGGDIIVMKNRTGRAIDDSFSLILRGLKGEATVHLPAEQLERFVARVRPHASPRAVKEAFETFHDSVTEFLAWE